MPRLLPAEVAAPRPHCLYHVSVSDLGPEEIHALAPYEIFERHVAHERRNDRIPPELPALYHLVGAYRYNLISVYDLTLFVAKYDPVRVPVERDPQVGARFEHLVSEQLRIERAAFGVYIPAVRIDSDCNDVRTQLFEYYRRDLVRGPVRAVEDYLYTFEGHIARERILREDHVPPRGVFYPVGLPDIIGRGAHVLSPAVLYHLLEFQLLLVGELETVPVEDLYAVVLVRVVRGRYDDTCVGPHTLCDEGYSGRGQGADKQHVRPHGGDTRRERLLEYITGQSRVLADDDFRFMGNTPLLEQVRERLSQLETHLGRHRVAVCYPPYAVCPEKAFSPVLQNRSSCKFVFTAIVL